MYTIWTYLVYQALSIGLTVWVAHTLHKNGRVFLVDTFRGNKALICTSRSTVIVMTAGVRTGPSTRGSHGPGLLRR